MLAYVLIVAAAVAVQGSNSAPSPAPSPAAVPQLLTREEIDAALARLDSSWQLTPDTKSIESNFTFVDFISAFGFMTRSALNAQEANHHPEWSNVWNTVQVSLTTDDAGGLTSLDFDLAAEMDSTSKNSGLEDASAGERRLSNADSETPTLWTNSEIDAGTQKLDSRWTVDAGKTTIQATFVFEDFIAAFGFMSRIALHAQEANHHPEWSNVWNTLQVNLTTDDVGGLTSLDFDLATEMDRAFEDSGLDHSARMRRLSNAENPETPPLLSSSEIDVAMTSLDSRWTVDAGKTTIQATFTFEDFIAAFGFMTRSALHAQEANHHPEWSNVWNTVQVSLTTDDVGGLTSLDFDLAAEMDSASKDSGLEDASKGVRRLSNADSETPPLLNNSEIDAAMQSLDPRWTVDAGRTTIQATIAFEDFIDAFGFMTRIALHAQEANHHPEWSNVWNTVQTSWTTDDAGGLTTLDFDLATEMDSAAASSGFQDTAGSTERLFDATTRGLHDESLGSLFACLAGGVLTAVLALAVVRRRGARLGQSDLEEASLILEDESGSSISQ